MKQGDAAGSGDEGNHRGDDRGENMTESGVGDDEVASAATKQR